MSILNVSGVQKIYTTRFGGNKVEALRSVSFGVEQGEYVAIMGESGSGKTTLLNILAALDKPTSGSVVLDGKDLSKIKESQVAAFRRDNLGFVFQEFNLLDTFTLEDNIYLPKGLASRLRVGEESGTSGDMLMKAAGKAFEGTHDFKAVRSVGTETKTTVRTVHWCKAEKEGDLITISICANGFLYNMCRAMVGTMVYASYGKLQPEEIPELLEKGDRRLTGPTMPPQGLYMNRIWYDEPVGSMFTD